MVRKRFLALLGKAHGAVYGSSVGINGYEPNKNTWNKRPKYIAAPGRRMRIRGYSVLCGQLRGVDPERGGPLLKLAHRRVGGVPLLYSSNMGRP